MEDIIAIIMVFSIPIIAIVGGYYTKLQKIKAEKGDGEGIKELRKQIGYLMAENEEVRNRLKNVEYLLTKDPTDDEREAINLDYEKEQINLDKRNK